MALSAAERARRARRRRRAERGTADLVMIGPGNQNARKHGAHAADVPAAAEGRLPGMPAYLNDPKFAEAVSIAKRRCVMAERVGLWVAGLTEEEQLTPMKAGSSAPAEIARQHDLAALTALDRLGLTPASSVRFGRHLEEAGRPDLALLYEAVVEAGEDA